MRIHGFLAAVAVFSGLFAHSAIIGVAAAAAATGGDSLDEVVVVATRTPVPLSSVGSSVTVLDETDIRASQAIDVADLLASTPGLTFARTGGIGQPSSVFIRGAESTQTLVVVDGVQVNDPSLPGGNFDFEDLLAGNIARIEILRGAQSTLYGSQAIGGVVSIVTVEPGAPFGGSASAEAGSHDTGYVTGSLGGRSDTVLWHLAADYYGTGGITCIDEALGGRRNCAAQNGSGYGELRYELAPGLQLDLRGQATQARTDFDGYDTPAGNLGDDREYGTSSQAVGYTGLTFHAPDSSLTQRLAFQYTDSTTREYDPDAPANYGSASIETYYGIGRNLRVDYQGTWAFAAAGHLVFGAQHEHSTIDTDTPAFDLVPMPLERDDSLDSGYLQAQAELLPGFTLTAGGRYDHQSVVGGHATGQFAGAWALDGGRTVLRASWGQGFRAPSLYELFSDYGNPGLRPEEASSWDFGAERHLDGDRAVLRATYFHRDSRDLIEFFDCSTPSPLCATEPYGYYANIARTSAQGVELEGALDLSPQLGFKANYTYTDAVDRSPGSASFGNALPRRPRDAANAAVSYRWPFPLTTALAARYSSASFDDAANTIALGGYVLVDLRAVYALSPRLELYGRIQNLADRRYETAYGYGQPGREGFVGVRTSF